MKKKHTHSPIVPIENTPFVSREYIKGDGIKVLMCDSNAQIPSRQHPDDIGCDVTLISRLDGKTEDTVGEVTYFGTGIKIKPPKGYFVEIVPRSSLHKRGYMLANSVGIIDPGYRGEVVVALYKFKECDDLELPNNSVQIILRKANYAHVQIVETLDDTERGDGGFGSTDNNVTYSLGRKKGKEKERRKSKNSIFFS